MENGVASSVQWMTRGQGQDRENNIGRHIHTPTSSAKSKELVLGHIS